MVWYSTFSGVVLQAGAFPERRISDRGCSAYPLIRPRARIAST